MNEGQRVTPLVIGALAHASSIKDKLRSAGIKLRIGLQPSNIIDIKEQQGKGHASSIEDKLRSAGSNIRFGLQPSSMIDINERE